LQAAVSSSRNARTVMSKNFQVIDISELEEWQAKYRPGEGPRYTLISREGEVLGIARPELMYLLRDKNPEAVIDKNFFVVASNTPWPVIMRGLRAKDTDTALVTSVGKRRSRNPEDLVGIITSREIARTHRDSAELIE
jgi:CIC family chloride channel protein